MEGGVRGMERGTKRDGGGGKREGEGWGGMEEGVRDKGRRNKEE